MLGLSTQRHKLRDAATVAAIVETSTLKVTVRYGCVPFACLVDAYTQKLCLYACKVAVQSLVVVFFVVVCANTGKL